ncbi:long-chain-fatty-acid--CoA ligase [Virgibacillus salexigens]|uniref:Long-chain-fatty-acid--CoA ligase n=1 Tax=Virgibacillus massiliensis TaxID=1462526 RepID=A0A024QIK0_9BACI|nr:MULTISPECIES: long-chain fatty acid--CoA ligase [Virgibacillus]CDQ42062.1 Long-chain-fatty-acid--CoA ligase [Virgibacillus massiliensis]
MENLWLEHIPEGNPSEIQIPEEPLPSLFSKSVEMYPDHIAITFFNQTLTYRELDNQIKNVARSLFQMGVSRSDKVALMLPNCPQYVISYYATLYCGATIVQLNPMYKAAELLHVLNDSEAEVLIVHDKLLPVVEKIQKQTPLTAIITASFENGSKFDDFCKQSNLPLPDVHIPVDDIAVLQYTGGTTGRSKGAMLTHYNLVANTLQAYATSQSRTMLGKERVLTISPLFHVYGMTSCMNLTFYIGGNLILVPNFDVEQTARIIEQTKPTIFPGVPTMYIALVNYCKDHPFDLSSIRTCTSGSAPLPMEVIQAFNETTGSSVAEGYGLSEASPVTHRNPISGLQKPGSIGIPIPNTRAKIVDIASGEEDLPIGEVGEMVVQGPQIMKGYWKQPEETDKVLRDGWLYTGDLAKMDEDGFFYIVGRKKELIIASGYNIYPIEIEDVIYSHPNVLEVAVIGIPDKYRGETVKAYVVRKDSQDLTETELIQFCRDNLASFKVPRLVEFVEDLPKTAVGKILKRALKEQLDTNNATK